VYGYQRLNVESRQKDPDSLLNWLKRVIATRRLYPAFGDGTLTLLPSQNPAILAYLRQNETQTLLAVNNLSAEPQTFSLDLPAGVLKSLLEDQPSDFNLPGYGFQWFEI
jgi:maltose alpha-D-glucosyltransferase / alpha-amylase